MSDYIKQHTTICNFNHDDSWVVLSVIEQQIKEKIERIGTPLKDWNIQINYGIKTGFNDAFIITGEKRKELIEKDPKSAEIIRPIIRGRDIKRYGYDFADLYIIATFPSLKINIEDYPSVEQHLLGFGYDRLKQTGETGSRKKTNNKWFETQDSISYWEVFSKQKIVWGEISDKTKFCIDLNGEYVCEATTFLMTGKNLLFLLCYLNSSLSEYLFSLIGTTTGVGTVRWKKFKIEQLPVPSNLQKEDYYYFESLAKKMINSINSEREMLEKKINDKIYQIFSLSKEEISLIEKSIFTRFV